MTSSELVPLTYTRSAFNTLHGTELEHHSSLLSQEQAEQINRQYDIEVYVGVHGLVPKDTDPEIPLQHRPTQQEYEAVAAVVDSLQPGDTLFVETHGYYKPSYAPLVTPEAGLPDSLVHSVRQELEELRRNSKIDAWAYAEWLASLKGIPVVYADCDAFDDDAFRGVTQGRGMGELMRTASTESDHALKEDMHRQRERTARNIIKDWALAHPRPEVGITPEDRKPKLVLLFGIWHKEGLDEVFTASGLQARIIEMQSTNKRSDRLGEPVGQMLGEVAASILGTMVTKVGLGESTPLEPTRSSLDKLRRRQVEKKPDKSPSGGIINRPQRFTRRSP